jgi:hypothetical protein
MTTGETEPYHCYRTSIFDSKNIGRRIPNPGRNDEKGIEKCL